MAQFTCYLWRKGLGGLKTDKGEAAERTREGERAAAEGRLRSEGREADHARRRILHLRHRGPAIAKTPLRSSGDASEQEMTG
jgi:hypothetical protein